MKLAIPLIVLVFGSLAIAEDNWPGFRGDGTGFSSASNLPEHWSPEEGIAWQATLPGYGQSAPVVWGNRVFVTSSDGPFQTDCQIHALRIDTGEKLWSRSIEVTRKVDNYFRNSRAAPTCAVDESGVYSFFASGDVTGMDHDGNVLWSVSLMNQYGEVENERGIASSLAQTEKQLFAVVDHHGPSYAVAIEKSTGNIAWKTDRGSRVPSWSSPIVTRIKGFSMLLISSSDTVDAYGAESGQLLWQLDGLKGNHIPSATVSGARVYIGSTTLAQQANDPDEISRSNCCLEIRSNDGRPSYEVLWSAQHTSASYATPLAIGGYVYYVNQAGVLSCVEEVSGKQSFAKRIGPCWASPIAAQHQTGEFRVYFMLKNGETVIVRPGPKYDQVVRNRLWDREAIIKASEAAAEHRKQNTVPADQAKPKVGPEKVLAGTPESQLHAMFSYGDPTVYGVAATSGCLLIRTGQQLFCVGSPNPGK